MSGIYIPNMQMPTECCVCSIRHYGHCFASQKRMRVKSDGKPKNCPLVPVPPHGRLIDADAMQAEWFNLNFDRKISDGTLAYWNYRLSQMPTIIPASEEGE